MSAPPPDDAQSSASHPWVYSATKANGKISFHVEVTDLQTTVGAIEITGVATQVNGAFAPIFGVTDVPAAPNGDPADADQKGRYFVDVAATPTPQHPFTPAEDVSIFTRASKVWVTVLGPGSDDGAAAVQGATVKPGPTWGKHRADSHMVAPDGAAPVGSTLSNEAPTPSHPWVYSATNTNGTITFHVEVTDFQTTVGPIEITGVATQVNGAYAPIFGVTDVPAAPNGDPADADQAGRYFVDVTATPTTEHPFTPTEDITVFTRASKVWVTVLGPGSDDGTAVARGTTDKPGPTWGKHRAAAHP
jgi:hypothetical protein